MERRLLLTSTLMLVASGVTGIAQTPPTTPAAPAAPPAAAPAAPAVPPLRVRGSIVGFTGNVLTVKSRDGQAVEIALKEPVTVSTVTKVKLTSIEPNSFIGTATRSEKDGKLVALEVLVFPEAMRGTGEGYFPWDLEPNSMMTNGTVKGAVKSAKGRELTVGYKDKASGTEKSNTIYVPPSAPVVTFAPATPADLKPGAKIFCIAMKSPDGKLTAARVTVGTHGVVPPM